MTRAPRSSRKARAAAPVEGCQTGGWKKRSKRLLAGFVAFLALLAAWAAYVEKAKSTAAFYKGILAGTDELLFKGRLTPLIVVRPGWFLVKFVLLFLAMTVGIVAVALVWGPSLRRQPTPLWLKLAVSATVAVVLPILAIGLTAEGPYWLGHAQPDQETAIVCPQCAELGPVAIRTYANNGSVEYVVDTKGEPGGPRGYARITLQVYQPDEEHGAGWAIFLLRGSDLSEFKELRFWIRGEKGHERIGIKMKDARGVEVPVRSIDGYLRGASAITASWSEVSVPLAAFPRVDFGLMDNLSLYVDGRNASTEPQTIYLGGMEWR